MRQQKYRRISVLSGVAASLLFLGFSDTARAQSVTLSGPGITNNIFDVTVQHGGVSPVEPVTVSTSEGGNPINSTVNVQVSQAAVSWLQIAEAPTGNTDIGTSSGQVVLHLTVNATNLTQGTQPTGTVTISYLSQPSINVVLTVAVTVSGSSLLSSTPSSLSFTTTVGTPENSVPTQTLTIASSGAQLGYNVTTSTQNGVFWLVPFQSTGNTGSSATDTITVGINPAGLTANTYQGTITVQSTTTADSAVINVTLVVAPNTTLSATPSTLQPFLYQLGTTPANGQLTQTLQVSSTNASVPFQVSMSPQVSWLVISPTSGATGTNGQAVPVSLSVNPSGLGANQYTTSITVSIVGGAALTPIPVQLVISANPLLSLSANSLSFVSQFSGAAPPASQSVQVTTVGTSTTSVPFTVASDSSWLSATESSTNTPATLTVSVNPSSLAVGPYTGHLTVTPNNSDANLYHLTITVNLTVGNTATVSAGPPLLVFAWETSQPAPQPQVVELLTQGQAVAFLLTTSVTTSAGCPSGWLSATSTSTSTQGATITVSANVTGMTPGVCPGSVTVSYPASSLTPQMLSIPVTINISNTALLNISFPLGFGNVTAAQGSGEVTQLINLTSTDPNTAVTDVSATSTSNGPTQWLFLGQNGTSTPLSLQVVYNPGALTPNTYGGSVSISSSKLPSSPLTVPVTLSITASTTVAITPTSLTFNQPSGGALPAAQTVTLTSSATGASFQTSIPSTQVCSWLQISPTSGPASGPVSFSVLQNSLPQNSYQCPVTFSFLNSATAPITVNATLVVGASQTLTVSPVSLTFAYQITGATPASQPLTVSSTGGAVAFTASATSNGNWLLIDTTSSTTGTALSKVINVSINPANFPSGTTGGSVLTGSISISAPGVLANPITVAVTVNVTAAPVPSVVQIINSATFGFGSIAPGELIAIRGTNLGPACVAPASNCVAGGTQFTVSNGTVSSTLSGVQVFFNNTPGTPTYVSPTQINVIVPWEVAGFTEVSMIVSYNGIQSPADQLAVVAVSPGIYTQNATGSGQAAVLNLSAQAGSPYNGPAGGTYFGTTIATAPAPQGSEVVLYLTGGGLTSPGGVDGTVTPSSPLYPLQNWTPGSSVVTATVGGVPATVLYAGAAPTLITGVVQINLQLPSTVNGSALPVVITIDGLQSQTTATIAVQ
jgi:uncharacterized protein (TIGR03437 family)